MSLAPSRSGRDDAWHGFRSQLGLESAIVVFFGVSGGAAWSAAVDVMREAGAEVSQDEVMGDLEQLPRIAEGAKDSGAAELRISRQLDRVVTLNKP
jgi:hypothetical protein